MTRIQLDPKADDYVSDFFGKNCTVIDIVARLAAGRLQ